MVKLPDTWSKWHIEELVGEGGSGKVYRAGDNAGNVCAIKMISGTGIIREADGMARLPGHPGLVRLLDQEILRNEENGDQTLCLMMEYLTDLEDWLGSHIIREDEAIGMMGDLVDGLIACEDAGIIHGDIKPGNIFLDEGGHAKLGDFGMARISDKGKKRAAAALEGTPRYMAPEVFHGQRADQRSDIYSLGLTFYILMNRGRDPWTDQTKQLLNRKDREEAFTKRMKGEALPDPVEASKAFGQILKKACAFRPYDRYFSAKDLKADLARLRNGSYQTGPAFMAEWTKTRKILAAMLLVFFLIVSAGTASLILWSLQPVFADCPCGRSAVMSLDRRGSLTLSGEGYAYVDYTSILWDYKDKVKNIIVKKGIRCVGFYGYGQERVLDHVERVRLPEGLLYIPAGAFSGFAGLKDIEIPESVREIGDRAFSECRSLKKVFLPDGIKSIGDHAFYGCDGLSDIRLPENLEEIGEKALSSTPWYEEQKESSEYTVVNGILLSYSGKDEKLTVPEEYGIRSIGPWAFKDCKDIEEVYLPSTLVSIGNGAFSGCSNLKRVELPDSLVRIGDYAFQYCSALKEMGMAASVSHIGRRAFGGSGLEDELTVGDYECINGMLLSYKGTDRHVEIPEELGITGICGEAFASQKQLVSIKIPESVAWIGEGCFAGCDLLEEISFPESLEEIEGGADSLGHTYVDKESTGRDYIVVGNLFLLYIKNVPEINLPDDLPVTRIEDGCFLLNENLNKLTIPDQISQISEKALEGDPNPYYVEDVELPGDFSEEEIWDAFKETSWYYER